MNWRDARLGDLIELQRGYDLPEQDRRPGDVPVCGSAGINGYHDTARASGPGVTVGRSGASIGVVTFVNRSYWPHNTALFVKDFKGNDPRFIAALLRSMKLADLNSGSAQPSLNRNFVYPLSVKAPDLDTQRRIAGILSAYDDLIENNERRIAILEEMARRVFREWFVDFRFPGHEAVRMVDTEAGRIPEGWEPQLLADVIDLDPTTKVAKDGEKPFVPMGALSTLYSYIEGVEHRSGNSGSKFKNGDTLLARITPCLENGKTALVSFLPSDQDPAFGSTEFIVMRGRRVPSSFVYCLARSEGFRAHAIKSMSGATGRQRVRNEAVAQFQLMVPPLDLLKQFDGLAAAALQQVVLLARASEQLRNARNLLLPRLISGELFVSSVEPLLKAAE